MEDLKLYRTKLEYSLRYQKHSFIGKINDVGNEIQSIVYYRLQDATQIIFQKILESLFSGKKAKKSKKKNKSV